jgi:hypothetical protein
LASRSDLAGLKKEALSRTRTVERGKFDNRKSMCKQNNVGQGVE